MKFNWKFMLWTALIVIALIYLAKKFVAPHAQSVPIVSDVLNTI